MHTDDVLSDPRASVSIRGCSPIQNHKSKIQNPGPLVVLLADSLPPYRVRVDRRIAHEVPELRIITLSTHDPQDGRWPAVAQADVPHVVFAPPGELTNRLGRREFFRSEWRKGGRIVRWLARHRPAAITINGYNDPARLRVLAWGRAHGVPVFIQADSNIRLDRVRGVKAAVKRAFVSSAIRAAFGVLPFGSLGGAYFHKYGARPNRTFYLPMEPDYELIESLPAEHIEQVRARFGLMPGRRRVLFSGRFILEKRVDLLVRAFSQVAAARPEWDLVLLGSGPLKAEVAALVSPQLAGRIVWIDALRDPADVFAVYHCCDVLALTSQYDAWALVVNEAVACGMALVCSDVVGSTAELLRDGVNGRLFRANDLDGLVAALGDVMNIERLPAMQAASRQLLAEWRRVGDPVEGFRQAMRACGVLPKPLL